MKIQLRQSRQVNRLYRLQEQVFCFPPVLTSHNTRYKDQKSILPYFLVKKPSTLVHLIQVLNSDAVPTFPRDIQFQVPGEYIGNVF